MMKLCKFEYVGKINTLFIYKLISLREGGPFGIKKELLSFLYKKHVKMCKLKMCIKDMKSL